MLYFFFFSSKTKKERERENKKTEYVRNTRLFNVTLMEYLVVYNNVHDELILDKRELLVSLHMESDNWHVTFVTIQMLSFCTVCTLVIMLKCALLTFSNSAEFRSDFDKLIFSNRNEVFRSTFLHALHTVPSVEQFCTEQKDIKWINDFRLRNIVQWITSLFNVYHSTKFIFEVILLIHLLVQFAYPAHVFSAKIVYAHKLYSIPIFMHRLIHEFRQCTFNFNDVGVVLSLQISCKHFTTSTNQSAMIIIIKWMFMSSDIVKSQTSHRQKTT